MPITASTPAAAFTFYYNLVGNNSDQSHELYRANNPWRIAKRYCHDLPVKYPDYIQSVKSLDDSVFLVTVVDPAIIEKLAAAILNDFAAAISPSLRGDTLVAAIPRGDMMVELVHSP